MAKAMFDKLTFGSMPKQLKWWYKLDSLDNSFNSEILRNLISNSNGRIDNYQRN